MDRTNGIHHDGVMKSKHRFIGSQPIVSDRIRNIDGGFSFIPHRFLRDGFWETLTTHELLLYFLLVLVGDRNGVSFYGCDVLCSLLSMDMGMYIFSRNGLIDKDLIAFDGRRFQVLSLPPNPTSNSPQPLRTDEDFEREDPATIRLLIHESLGGALRKKEP